MLGKSDVQVQIGKQCKKLPLIVVEGNGTPLLGRQWLLSIKLPWNQILPSSVNSVSDADMLVCEFADLLRNTTGKIKNSVAKLEVRDNVKPVFSKSRTVPFAMKKKIQEELDRLENDRIIRKVQHSD